MVAGCCNGLRFATGDDHFPSLYLVMLGLLLPLGFQ